MVALAQYSDTWWFPNSRTAGCTLVKIFPVDSNIPANLYADSCGGHKLPNPLRTSELGVLTFWAEEGKYWIHIDGRTFPITVGEAGCVTPQDLDYRLADHVQAADPHGDRSAANAALMHHAACTKSVHGIVDTANLETKDGAQGKANEAIDQALCQVQAKIDQHAAQTTNVHGICDTGELETKTGAQQKANEAIEAAGLIAGAKAGDIARETAQEVVDNALDGVEIPDVSKLEAKEASEQRDAELQEQIDALKGDGTETPGPGGGISEEEAQQLADAARDAAVAAAGEAAKKADGELQEQIDALKGDGTPTPDPVPTPEPGDGVTEQRAQEIADEAAKKAADGAKADAEKCCKANADAIKAGDEALGERVKALEDGDGGTPTPGPTPTPEPEPGKWETPDGAQKKADKSAADAVAAHVKTCHTLEVVSKGVATEKGWGVELVELRKLGGVRTAFIRLVRTGENIVSEGPDFTNDKGAHEEGNIVPDLLIAKVEEDWRPPQTYLTSAHTSYGTGSVRVHPDGNVYLLDWATNNALQGGHKLRFEYEWLTKSKCEEDGDSGGTPTPGPKPQEPAPGGGEVSQEALVKALAAYPSAYAGSEGKSALESKEWTATAGEELSVTVKVPPSRKVRVTTSMRASNSTSGLSQAHQAVEIARGDDVVVKAGDFPVVTLSHVRLRETDAASRAFHVDFTKIANGVVKAGDEVTVSVHNRSTVGKTEVLDRDVAVESLFA